MKDRLLQFDVLKGFGIILVLLGHTPILGLSRELIYGFHMPLFFFCSGFFFKKKRFSELLFVNCKQLLIPYVFFLLTLLVSNFIVELHASKSVLLSINNICQKLEFLDERSYFYLTIWFLPCLFIVRLMFSFVQYVSGNIYYNILTGGVFYAMGNLVGDLPVFLDTSLTVYIFYSLGNLFYITGMYDKKISSLGVSILLLSYCILVFYLRPSVEIKYNVFPWYLLLLSLIAIFSFYQISLRVSSYRNFSVTFLADTGKRSLTLFGLHRPLWFFIYPICLKLGFNLLYIVIAELLTAFFIIWPIHSLLEKKFPLLIGQSKRV